MNYRIITKIFNAIAAIMATIFLLLTIKSFYLNENLLIHPEFFVNYQGGFIRRGFDGNLLYLISEKLNVGFFNVLKIYNLITFSIFIIAILFLKFKRKIPTFILFSASTLLLYFLYLERGLKKDHIVFIFIIVQALFFSKDKYLKNTWWKLLFVFISIVGTLIHEVFFIITFFPNIIGFWRKSEKKFLSFAKYCLLLLPSSILFILLITEFSGNSNQVETIINSYQNLNYDLDYLRLLFTKSYYFWQQNYSFNQIILFLLMIFLNGLFVSSATYSYLKSSEKKSIFLLLLVCQMIILLLLSMVTIDYGRWVVYCFTSVLIFIYNYSFSENSTYPNNPILDRIFEKLRIVPFLLFFFLAIPHSHWNGKDGVMKNNILLQLKNKLSEK